MSATCLTDAAGECSVLATSSIAAAYTTTVSIAAGDLSNSPASFEFGAGGADTSTSSVAVAGSPATANGVAAITLTATIEDADNNAVEGETVTFAATADVEFDGGTTGASATCLTDAAGECSVLATSSVAATYATTVSIAAGDLSNSPASFEFEAGAADTSTSTVAVAGSPATANGIAAITLTATIEDADNNVVEGETVTFAATADVEFDGGTTGASATCLTDAAGECSVLATSSVAAAYTTTVSIAAGDLSNSPASFEFGAGAADISTSTVAVAGSPATANGVAAITLTATIEDADNNPVEGETVTFAATADVEFDAGTTGASATCLTDAAGECSVLATSSVADTYATTVSIAAGNLSNSPASFEFETGAADTSTSTVAVVGSPTTANGIAAITLTATIEDADNKCGRRRDCNLCCYSRR